MLLCLISFGVQIDKVKWNLSDMKISQFGTTGFFLANGNWNTRLLGTVKSFTLGHHQWIPNLHSHNSSKTDISLFTNGMITTLQNWLKLPPKPQKLKSFVFWDGFAIVIDCEFAGNEVLSSFQPKHLRLPARKCQHPNLHPYSFSSLHSPCSSLS